MPVTPGAVGALLRREGLYSLHLTPWRGARERGNLAGAPKQREPGRRVSDPLGSRSPTQLRRQVAPARKQGRRLKPPL